MGVSVFTARDESFNKMGASLDETLKEQVLLLEQKRGNKNSSISQNVLRFSKNYGNKFNSRDRDEDDINDRM